MRFVIVTGVSGAGKTAALKMLEDMNYFCVDNLPIQLLEKFASLLPEMQSENVRNVAESMPGAGVLLMNWKWCWTA